MAGIEGLISGITGALGGGGGLGGMLKGVTGGGGAGGGGLGGLAGLLGGGGGAGGGLGSILGKVGEMAMGLFSSLMGAMKGGGGGSPLGDAKLGAGALKGGPQQGKALVEQGPDLAKPAAGDAKPPADGPAPGAKPTAAGKAFPVEGGKVIGHPHQGTHTLGNWQSDNALDIAAPEGTPIFAPSDGVVTKAKGSNSDPSSRFNGFNFELEGDGNAWFMQHLSEMHVKDGDHVKQGQLIGRVGSANNNSHLHIGQRDGNPDETFKV